MKTINEINTQVGVLQTWKGKYMDIPNDETIREMTYKVEGFHIINNTVNLHVRILEAILDDERNGRYHFSKPHRKSSELTPMMNLFIDQLLDQCKELEDDDHQFRLTVMDRDGDFSLQYQS